MIETGTPVNDSLRPVDAVRFDLLYMRCPCAAELEYVAKISASIRELYATVDGSGFSVCYDILDRQAYHFLIGGTPDSIGQIVPPRDCLPTNDLPGYFVCNPFEQSLDIGCGEGDTHVLDESILRGITAVFASDDFWHYG